MRVTSCPECEKRHYNPVGVLHRRSPPVSISGTDFAVLTIQR